MLWDISQVVKTPEDTQVHVKMLDPLPRQQSRVVLLHQRVGRLRYHDFILPGTEPRGEEKCQNKSTPTSGAKTKTVESELTPPSRLCAALQLKHARPTVRRYSQSPHGQQGALEGPLK